MSLQVFLWLVSMMFFPISSSDLQIRPAQLIPEAIFDQTSYVE